MAPWWLRASKDEDLLDEAEVEDPNLELPESETGGEADLEPALAAAEPELAEPEPAEPESEANPELAGAAAE